MQYNPAMDGLRAFAAISVMALHAGLWPAQGGYMGVDVFFVLSGYLITRLLVENGIDLRRFYARRAMRLYPALLVMLALYLIFGPSMFGSRANVPRDSLLAATYLTDYSVAFWHTPKYVSHTWSLSVEEQFYILWPLGLSLLLRRFTRYDAGRIMVMAAAALLVWRVFCIEIGQGWYPIYYRLDTHADGLAAGCALALLGTSRIPRWTAWPGVLLIVSAMLLFPWKSSFAGLPIATLGTVLVIAELQNRGPMSELLSFGWLPYIGRLSYGLYLFHFPLMEYLKHNFNHSTTFMIGTLGAFAIAAVSYHTIEAVFRGVRHRIVVPSNSAS